MQRHDVYSSSSSAMVAPTAIASRPIPENHFEIFPLPEEIEHLLFNHAGFNVDAFVKGDQVSLS
jgi:hypothetical protein